MLNMLAPFKKTPCHAKPRSLKTYTKTPILQTLYISIYSLPLPTLSLPRHHQAIKKAVPIAANTANILVPPSLPAPLFPTNPQQARS